MARRVESLNGQVVCVVGPFAARAGPFQDRAPARFAHLLLVLVKGLVGGFLPEECEVACHRDQALADGLAPREEDRAVVAVVAGRREVTLDGRMGEVAGGDNMRNRDVQGALNSPGLGEMDLQEAAVSAG